MWWQYESSFKNLRRLSHLIKHELAVEQLNGTRQKEQRWPGGYRALEWVLRREKFRHCAATSQHRESGGSFGKRIVSYAGVEFGHLFGVVADELLHDGMGDARLFQEGNG